MSKDDDKLAKSLDEVGKRMIVSLNAMFSLMDILNDRVTALELHAKGMSFEDMVDGKIPQIGPTEEHVALLKKLRAELEELNTP